MSLAPIDWSVVIVGRWNRGILTPQGIATRLFQVPSETEVALEVPMDAIGPFRVGHEGLVVMVTGSRLIVETTANDFAGLQRALAVAHRAMESLPETPVFVTGFNMKSKGDSADPRLAPLVADTQLLWDRRFGETGYPIARRDVTWVVEWQSGKISVNLVHEQTDRVLRLNLNFEQNGTRAEMLAWLARPVDEIKQQARGLFTDILRLPLEAAEWLR